MERMCALYGYRRIQTPAFEDTELFQRTSGAGSDIVQKEMYTFEDRGERSLTLRPEGTAPICRAYIEHGMHREPQPVKLYTIATMYRYAAPQRGRFREHTQLSLECIGSAEPSVDAEVIQYYDALLRNLGIRNFELQLNSIGDRTCRPAYIERLNEWLDAHSDVLDDDAKQKRATSPLRVFDVKNPKVRAALEDAPKILDSLCDECAQHFARVRMYLDEYGVAVHSSCARSCAASTTTRARCSSSSARGGGQAPTIAAAVATTTSPRRAAGHSGHRFAGGMDRVTKLMAASGEEVVAPPAAECWCCPRRRELDLAAGRGCPAICRTVRSTRGRLRPQEPATRRCARPTSSECGGW